MKKKLVSKLLVLSLALVMCVSIFPTKQVMAKDIYNDYKDVPISYRSEAEKQGKFVVVKYNTKTYDSENNDVTKLAYVYLPYGYRAKDTKTKYNILYLMHGRGESELLFVQMKRFKTIIDNMIANGDMEPTIIVTPTFYNDESISGNGIDLTKNFSKQLTNDLMPTIEGKFHTYAKTTDEAGFVESRDHRAFGGFSMGSVTTWFVFDNCLKYFKWFIPISGDYWGVGNGMEASANDKAAGLVDVIKNSGYSKNDFFIYACTSEKDYFYSNLNLQIQSMLTYKDYFTYGMNSKKENIYFCLAKDFTHENSVIPYYLYNALQVVFK